MKCHIYYAKDGDSFFLILPNQIESIHLPDSLKNKANELEYLGVQEIISGKSILGVEFSEIKSQINKQGYYIKNISEESGIDKLYSSYAGAAIGSALLLGSLIGPVGWASGPLLGYWIAKKAKDAKNDSNS